MLAVIERLQTRAERSGGLEIRPVSGSEALWQDYVARSPQASRYHRLEWIALIERTFGHRCYCLMALDGNDVQGLLPLCEMKSRMFGHFLVSLPFCTYGGMVAETPEAESALVRAAEELARKLGAEHIEIRQDRTSAVPWVVRQHKASMLVPLQRDAALLWSGLSSRLRGKVRSSVRAHARFSVAGPEGIGEFYAVFARNMRDLGTPVYPRRLFEEVLQTFSGCAHVFLVHIGGRAVAGAVGLQDRDTLELPWICSDYDYSRRHANEFLYWSMLEWACHCELRWVDLGRSSIGSGPYRFKKQWNPEERPLYWYYWMRRGGPPPRLSPENPKYRLAIRCWQRMPLALTGLFGPRIVRYIP